MPKMSAQAGRRATLVVGGGPAGSAAAILLARAGLPVDLVERKSGAHDKVCGEFISWEAAQYLQALDIDLPGLGAQPVTQLRLYQGDVLHGCQLPATAWSLSRRRLDAALLEQAGRAGARLRRGQSVRTLRRQGQDWCLEFADQGQERARTVLLACGKHELRQWPRRLRKRADLIGFKMHLHLQPAQQAALQGNVEIHLFNGGYAGLEPVEEGRANLCFLVSRQIYHDCGKQWPLLLEWLAERCPVLQLRLSQARACWPRPLAVYGTPYGYLREPGLAQPGLYFLGDQTAVIPSFAGDGIAIALHSAFLAARGLAAGHDAHAYSRQAFRDFRAPVRRARRLAALLSHAPTRQAALLLAGLWPGILRHTVQAIRLPGPDADKAVDLILP